MYDVIDKKFQGHPYLVQFPPDCEHGLIISGPLG